MPRKPKKVRGVTETKTRWKIRFVSSSRQPREKAFYFDKGAFSPAEVEDLRNRLYRAKELGWDPWSGLLPWESAEEEVPSDTIHEAVERYGHEKRALGERGLEGGWSERTYYSYMTDLRAFVRLVGPDRPITSLTSVDVERWILSGDVAEATRRTRRRLLRTLLRHRERAGDPVPDVDLPRLARPYKAVRAFFTEEDVEAICRAHVRIIMQKMHSQRTPPWWWRDPAPPSSPLSRLWMPDAYRILFYQCRRRGELFRMLSGDVDMTRRLHLVRQSKTKTDFWAPITPPALPILQEMIEGKAPDDPLFPAAGRLVITRWFQRALARAVVEGDVEEEKSGESLKTLRRSGRAFHQRHGMLPHEVQLLLGHASIQTTERSYAVSDAERVRDRFEEAHRKR